MCFTIDKKETTKLRAKPPKYGWRRYERKLSGRLTTRYYDTPLQAGIQRADIGSWSRRGNAAAHGMYCYRSRPIARLTELWWSSYAVIRVKVIGRVRFANKQSFTCDGIEISKQTARKYESM